MSKNSVQNKSRDSFGSRFGVLVAMAGSAVGLGNLWRFPYLVGENGGAAFIILYLAMIFVLCLPIMFSEFLIGRRGHKNAIGSLKALAPGTQWKWTGILGVFGAFFVLSFYNVVGGWSLEYLVKSLSFEFTKGDGVQNFEALFTQFATSTFQPILFTILFLLMTATIVLGGIKKGIERFSKIMMPLLFVIVIIIAVRSLTLPGAKAGINYLFNPDFSKVTTNTVMAALGQAFFSLSIGCGTILTYASYVKKDENIMKCSVLTVLADTTFAIIAGCAIMPAVFAFGISPQEGPGLVFVTLPGIFAQLPLGGVIAILFFLTLVLAALTSSISLLEVLVAPLIEECKIPRRKAIILTFAVISCLSCLCSLSQGVLSDIKVFGLNIFDMFDKTSSNIVLPLGALMVVLFVGWKLGKKGIYDELTNQGTLKFPKWLMEWVIFVIRFLAPVVIALVMVCQF